MKTAQTLTLTWTINPQYGDAEDVVAEIEESLEWLSVDHRAIKRTDFHVDDGGVWFDPEEVGDESA